jgi:hypothetical protein
MSELESQPLQVMVRRLIEATVAHRLDQPDFSREIERLARTLPRPAPTPAGCRWNQSYRRLLEAHRGELAITDISLALLFCKNVVKGSLHDVLMAPPAVTKEAMTDELTAMVLRYLTGRSA